MSILDYLMQETPRRRSSPCENPQYKATKKMIQEIEKAQQLGYSWCQICSAAQKEWAAAGIWRDSWKLYDTQRFFMLIKKEAATV